MKKTHLETLRDLEGRLRAMSTDLWVQTVDDPETATVASELAGMTPERAELRAFMRRLEVEAEAVEELINSKLGGAK